MLEYDTLCMSNSTRSKKELWIAISLFLVVYSSIAGISIVPALI